MGWSLWLSKPCTQQSWPRPGHSLQEPPREPGGPAWVFPPAGCDTPVKLSHLGSAGGHSHLPAQEIRALPKFTTKAVLEHQICQDGEKRVLESALPSSQPCLGTGHATAPAAAPGTVPDFPPALQVLLDHHHHGPFVQVHFVLVSCSVGVNNRVLLLCWEESEISQRNCLMETWPQLANGYEVLYTNANSFNLGGNTQRYTTIQREMTVKCIWKYNFGELLWPKKLSKTISPHP